VKEGIFQQQRYRILREPTCNDMTTNPLTNFNEIVNAYQDSHTYVRGSPNTTINSSRCLNCKQPLVNTNFSPFCGAICLGAWNSERAKDAKGSEKNLMLSFSEVFRQ
jgi:endogenous inhibitor of DNA gyrase (YacG/DUF329 family)